MFGYQDDPQQSIAYTDAQPITGGDPSAQPAAVEPAQVPVSDASQPAQPLLEPTADDGFTDTPSEPTSAPSLNDPSPATPAGPGDDTLLTLKQQAMQQLSPLVGQLEQNPEEKFRTTMMMIQATDNQSLLQTAFEAAQAITDDKARAQALLDVINEINYFTQHQSGANHEQ